MTGMKEGAGEDPFADDDEDNELTPDLNRSSSQDSVSTTDESAGERGASRRTQAEPGQIPFKFRCDGVQDGRNRVPLFLQEETKRAEREALRELEG